MSRKNLHFFLRHNSILIISFITFTILLLTTFLVEANVTNFSNLYPIIDSTIKISNPEIRAYVKSTNNINDQSLKLMVNTTQVPAELQYKGYWVSDYYGDYWAVSDYSEGTISYQSGNLKDGLNKIDVSISDQAGNTLTDSWSFNVAEPPKFMNIKPAPNSQQVSVNHISATITDNSAVNWSTVKLKINNTYVDASMLTINQTPGTVTYNGNFPTGNYTAMLEASDNAGDVATRNWSFIVDSTPPERVYLYDFYPGVPITGGKLKFGAKLTDLIDIKNVSISLYNTPLDVDFRHEGFTDYYGGYITTDRKIAYINYEAIIPNGDHTISLQAEDSLGNKMIQSWNFSVDETPIISNETPIKYSVNSLKPTIPAVVKTLNGPVNKEFITLKLSGETVSFDYNASSGSITYIPEVDLKNETSYTVNLTVSSQGGLPTTRDWKFYTNTYPDMNDSGFVSCNACHRGFSSSDSNGPLEDVHRNKFTFTGNHTYNTCDNCHKYISLPAGCSQCHDDSEGNYAYAPHGSTPTIKYRPVILNKYSPVRVNENREMIDCIVCHQPGTGLNNHDIPELHKTTDESCTNCHAQSLTSEHAREDRTDNKGNIITCNTCHESSVPEVVQVISNKDTSCSACHGEASHDELHVYEQMDNNCIGCHTNTLTKAHKAVNVTCANCHESQDQVVVNAIANNDKACQTCHTDPIHQNQHMDCSRCHKEPLPKVSIPAH